MFLVFNIDQTIGGKQFGRWNMGGAGVVGAAAAATTAAATTTTTITSILLLLFLLLLLLYYSMRLCISNILSMYVYI